MECVCATLEDGKQSAVFIKHFCSTDDNRNINENTD